MRNPAQASPFMTETRRDVSMLSLDIGHSSPVAAAAASVR
jgi:hypothetical protein